VLTLDNKKVMSNDSSKNKRQRKWNDPTRSAKFVVGHMHSILQHTATHCNTLQHTTIQKTSASASGTTRAAKFVVEHISDTRPHTATHYNILQYTATHCNTLHLTAAHCSTLQHTATLTWNDFTRRGVRLIEMLIHICRVMRCE